MDPASEAQQARASRAGDLASLSVVIPAFNERAGISATLSALRAACPEVEIVVVDDGSTDDTGQIASEIEGVKLIRHSRNRGYGAALKTGIRETTRPYVAWYDGDGQHAPADLIAVAGPVLRDEVDVVIGVRGPDSARQRDRTVGKAVLKWVAQVLSGTKIPDLNSGLRCFRRDFLRRYLHLLPDGFSASTTSTMLTIERGYRVGHVPITAHQRSGKSSVRIFTDGMTTLNLIVRLVVLFKALKVFTLLGLSLIVPGLIYGLTMAIVRGEGFPTLAGTAVLAGLLTVFMGILADQISDLRKERFEDPWTE